MAPESVGPYRILQKLGSGGMGDVYLADDTRLGRQVALKSLTEKWARVPDGRRRLLREARAVAGLNHTNVAAIYDIVETAEATWIVMEYAPGESLAAVLRRGPLTPEAVVWVGVQLCDALGAAHARNIVHRDLKPANLMLSPEGHLKVLDFGLAKSLDLDSDSGGSGGDGADDDLSDAGRLVGTLPYVPPEHILSERVDERSDVYSAGVVLFELLSGQRPYDGPDKKALAQAIVDGHSPDLQALRPEAPADLVRVVKRAMAREPSERPPTAGALRAELALLSGAQSGWHTLTDLQRPLGLRSKPSSSRRRQGRRRLGWIGAVAIVPALLASWVLWGRWQAPPKPPPSPRPPVVAVLPLSNASGDAAYDALVIGFADLIVNALTGPGVNVVSRSAVMEARGKSPETSRLTHELGVDLFVEGSVQRSAKQVRIALSVARAATKVVTWSRVFEGGVDDMLGLEKRAAQAVAEAVKGGISAEDVARIERNVPSNQEALEKYGQARRLLDRNDVTGNAARAAQLFQEVLTREPTFALAAAGLAEAQWVRYAETKDQQFAEEARRAVDQALRLDPSQSQVRLSLAEHLGRTGKTPEAIAELRRVLNAQPASDDAHRGLGELLIREGQVPEGLAELHRAIALRPDFWKNHDVLGLAFFDLGRYSESAGAWMRVTQLLPESSWGYLQLGAAQQAAGEREKAVENYRRSIALDPSKEAWLNLGSVDYAQGRYAEARAAFDAALRLDPNYASGHRNLGDLLRRQGDVNGALRHYKRAVSLAQEAVRVNPANGLERAKLAVYEAKAGQIDEALAEIGRAMALAPENVEVLYRMAIVNALAGRSAEAREMLGRALDRGFSRALASDDEDVAALLPAAGGVPSAGAQAPRR